MQKAPTGVTMSQPAVMPTRPAKAPLSVMETSGFLYLIQVMVMAPMAATAAERFVLTKILEAETRVSSPVMETVDAPLKPNQANQRMNTPRAAKVMLQPGMALGLPSSLYLPMRGPTMAAPINAATPPAICTAVEPAKSWKPSSASQPPPQIQ